VTERRVLIIDDEIRVCRIIEKVAKKLGIKTSATDNPALFESAYLEFESNMIFLDLQMPGFDGIELLRKLADQNSKAAIVLISGMDESVINTSKDLGTSLGLNMAGSLQKPLDIDKIEEILKSDFKLVKPQVISRHQVTEEELLRAIEKDELVVYYQPQIDFKSGKIVGAEALVRWQDPDRGLIFPDSFIPLAEKNERLIGKLTETVLEKVLQNKIQDLSISVNISAKLLNNISYPDEVAKLLTKYKYQANLIMVEVTETGVMEDPVSTMDILVRFRLKNIKLSIDDYGTANSTLVQLHRMPFTELKVDKSFVMQAMKKDDAATIILATIELGHKLGLRVVAEGVEDQETYDWLKDVGCDIAQGYHIAKPVDLKIFLNWMKEYNLKLSKTS
jgi:EAL domain-containing protein (putative c-di-GMP-specific phosphodiesterase class I)/FixJ family two-component response regulator